MELSNFPWKIIFEPNRRSRNIRLSVKKNGQVKVTAPFFTPQKTIDNFIWQNQDWIENAIRKSHVPSPILTREISILGKPHRIQWITDPDAKEDGQVIDGIVIVRTKIDDTDKAYKVLKKWLINEAKDYLPIRLQHLSKRYGLKFDKISIRSQSTRWGSCSSQDGISLNWQLILLKPELIDYVVIHELMHLVEHNHSSNFWGLVVKYCPDWKKLRKELKSVKQPF